MDDSDQTPPRSEQPVSNPLLRAAIERHTAGATVVHRSPFTDLEVPAIVDAPHQELRDHWVKPLYMSFFDPSSDSTIETLRSEMNRDMAYTLLSYFNWRPRLVGAYIVALRQLHELTDLIGRLLLRSDVCFAGTGYCLALAQLNTPQSRQFLHEYLDYYLTRNDLWFDQGDAIGAVAYLDAINSTKDLRLFINKWNLFIQNKPNWDLARSCSSFSDRMGRIKSLVDKFG